MTNLFRNSSPGALTLQQSVEQAKKRLVERGLQMRKARELAAKGRGSDTEVAHVAIGEIVLPKVLQTSDVINAIRQAARDADIPFNQLRIGSASNSINPDTGMPEFGVINWQSGNFGAQPNSNFAPPSNPFGMGSAMMGAAPYSSGFGGAAQPNAFDAMGNQQPTTPPNGNEPPAKKSDNGSLDGVLSGMSKSDLEKLKIALNNASTATGAFGVAVGALFVLLNPASLAATITIGGLALMTVSFSYLANKVDEYLMKQEKSEGQS